MVTGGPGYISSNAVEALLDAGYELVVLDNLVIGFDWAVDPRGAFVQADEADEAAVRTHGMHAIMHFARSREI